MKVLQECICYPLDSCKLFLPLLDDKFPEGMDFFPLVHSFIPSTQTSARRERDTESALIESVGQPIREGCREDSCYVCDHSCSDFSASFFIC